MTTRFVYSALVLRNVTVIVEADDREEALRLARQRLENQGNEVCSGRIVGSFVDDLGTPKRETGR